MKQIKLRIACEHRLKDIARDMGVNPVTISYIKSGKTWGHVTFSWDEVDHDRFCIREGAAP